MQKQKQQFVIILVLLIVCLAGFLGMRYYNQKQEETEEADTIVVLDLAAEDITAFSYELDGERLSFSRSGESWVYDADTSIDMDEDTIDSMLGAVEGLTATEEITGYESLSEYGLEEPSDTLTFVTEEGTTTLYLGDKNTILSKYYVKTSASDSVYLVSTSLADKFSKTVEDLTAEVETEEETEEVTEDAGEEATESVTEEATEDTGEAEAEAETGDAAAEEGTDDTAEAEAEAETGDAAVDVTESE